VAGAATNRAAVAVAVAGVRAGVPARELARVVRAVLRAEAVRNAMISVALVSAERMAVLNRRHLKQRGPTDVIAFGLARSNRGPVVGDVYVSPEVARANASRLGVSGREEVVRLVVHGVLHVLGWDHPESDSRVRSAMWRRQEELVRRVLHRVPR
jgi:probable rRNA maturation factor